MNKSEYNQLIGKRLSHVLEQLHMTQQQLLLRCAEKGYQISQSSLSKMLSGSSIQLLPLMQVCQVLELSTADLLSLNPDESLHVPTENVMQTTQHIIRDATHDAFRGYLGDYHIYFYTTKNEDFIHEGTFHLIKEPSTNHCLANFRFKTGIKDEHGNDIEKCYWGPVYYSIPMQTMYCELSSEEIGEKGYMLFHYDFLTYQRLECRLAVAITVSSGLRRLPTMHKLLLTRTPLSPDELHFLSGQLKLNNSEILISENAFREFLRDPKLPPKFFQYFGEKETIAERFISSVASIPYLSFNESFISDSFLPPLEKAQIICLLRKYSTAPKYNKISDKADEIVYKFLQMQNESKENDDQSLTDADSP